MPRITLSTKRDADGAIALGDINSLSIGFGIFQAWLFIAVLGMASTFAQSNVFVGAPFLNEYAIAISQMAFFITCGVCLLIIGITNQALLRFYVGKRALVLACVLSFAGTAVLFGSGWLQGLSFGTVLAIVGGISMGAGASLMFAMWGTAFARYEFNTIIGNATLACALAIIFYIILSNWIPSPISGILSILLPVPAALVLWRLTPVPYYRRQEIPIFSPLSINVGGFIVRFGFPTFVFGVSLGILCYGYVMNLFTSPNITVDLVIVSACVLGSLVLFIAIAALRETWHWDMLFRWLIPLVACAFLCVPLVGALESIAFLAVFLIVLGFFLFYVVMWVFFADLSQEFRLSPIFVFGIGQGLLEIGLLIGLVAVWALDLQPVSVAGAAGYGNGYGVAMASLVMIVLLVFGYSLLPRQREIKAIVGPSEKRARKLDEHGVVVKDGAEALEENIDEDAIESIESATSADIAASGAEIAEAVDAEAETIAAVNVAEMDTEDKESAKESEPAKGRFYKRCEEIADQFMLSRRESEVLFLLAKGHNAAFIQDKLCVSRSTAKTHINHIYRKMDIHTQQELLNMVEDRRRNNAAPDVILPGMIQDRDALREVAKSTTEDAIMKTRRSANFRTDIFGR